MVREWALSHLMVDKILNMLPIYAGLTLLLVSISVTRCNQERHFKLACDKKIPHEYLDEYAHVICTLEALGGDLKSGKLTEDFVKLTGPELGKAEVLKDPDSFREFICSSGERKENSSLHVFTNNFRQQNGTMPKDVIFKCMLPQLRQLFYEEICIKKNPIAREVEIMAAGCFKEVEITPNCTEPLTKIANDPNSVIEFICASSTISNLDKFQESSECLGEESKTKFYKCVQRLAKKLME